jgi:hypothetical protein
MLSTAEDATRRPVWIALSDLFLDTDVRLHYASIVGVLAASPCSLDQLGPETLGWTA